MRQYNMSFHLEEYRALRNEILLYTRREILVLFYISIVNAGVLSWVISSLNSDMKFKGPILIAALVPVFFTLVGWRYYRINDQATDRIAKYLMRIEAEMALHGFGWENSIRGTGKKKRLGHFFIGNVIFFILMCISLYSFALALVNLTQ